MFRNLYRLSIINLTLAKFGLDEIILSLNILSPLRFIRWFNPYNWFRTQEHSHAVRLRLCIESLGPIFIKFGQMLSTRRDLIPDAIVDELEVLLDKVPPFPVVKAKAIIEKQLGQPIPELFQSFDDEVLASASIAQVHCAVLNSGEEVVVKVVRPNIKKIIERDIALLMVLAKFADKYWSGAKRIKPIQIVEEFEKTLYYELDLVREASNASVLKRNFEGSDNLYVPQVYLDYCRTSVLVIERIKGIPVSDIKQLNELGVCLKTLSQKGVDVFFTQVYQHNFFHADMHPGNIFIDPSDPQNPKYIAVDFGIMGSLTQTDQRYLAENFVAFFNRDYRRVAELHIDSGWVDNDTRIDDFESAIRSVCEPLFEKPLAEISFAYILVRLFETAREFNMEIQPQLLLLQKTFLHIEGLGRQLYPQLNLWDTAKPYLERWLSEQLGVRALIKGFKKNLPYIAENLPEIPQLAYTALKKIAHNDLEIKWRSDQLVELQKEVKKSSVRSVQAITGGSLLISASLIAALDGISPTMVLLGGTAVPMISLVLVVPAVLLLVKSFIK